MTIHDCTHLPSAPSYYKQAVQAFSQYLFKKGWVISHYIVATLFGEPVLTLANSMRQLSGWKAAWKAQGFFDAGSEEDFKLLQETLKTHLYAPPVILLHSFRATPAVWNPWIPELAKAKKEGKIGEVITLQLPNDITQEIRLVYQTISRIHSLYQQAYPGTKTPMDLIGHSRGGYVAHLVSFSSTTNMERRWHTAERNPLVRKVIAVAAPTWLCCDGQKEKNNSSIYPEKGFTKEQQGHEHLVDFVGTEDAISPTTSLLPQKQVHRFAHGHLGMLCPKVAKAAIEILNQR